MTERIHLFGIRHHGPGSARSLRKALAELQPDIVLIEGPPDANDLIPLVADETMKPPVALLIYADEKPQQSAFYPFAVFSPEWQAMQYALEQQKPVRFIDLPITHQFARDNALVAELEAQQAAQTEEPEQTGAPESEAGETDEVVFPSEQEDPAATERDLWQRDPLAWLARAAGFEDSERWWNYLIEQRGDSSEVFVAIEEAMTELRNAIPSELDPRDTEQEQLREAWMRQCLRQALSEGYERIAVVCGAWHVPALANLPPQKHDAALLKGLPKTKVNATWVPWTYDRLSRASGYGAGIKSPGWYEHLWRYADQRETIVSRWMTQVAHLLRAEDIDASSASVIEAVRLADALAALRDHPLPGLSELNEAAEALFCFGNSVPLDLIRYRLIIGSVLGQVPDSTPMVPLQQDLTRLQKSLRLKPEAAWKDYDLDLRKPNDLARSHLLHRLKLLGIDWGQFLSSASGRGTFRESWRLQWQPELSVKLIEASLWGSTVAEAASNFAVDRATNASDLNELSGLIDALLLAELPTAIAFVAKRLEDISALTSDVHHLMQAIPPLANTMRYGNVRGTNSVQIGHVLDSIVTRMCIGLPNASSSLNDDAASELYEKMIAADQALGIVQHPEYTEQWEAVLNRLTELPNIHGLLVGRSNRMLFDRKILSSEELATRLSYALSEASDPVQKAAWLEGLLKGGAFLLLYGDELWDVLDQWLVSLSDEAFEHVLPLLRRTFSSFERAERRNLSSRVTQQVSRTSVAHSFDHSRGDQVLPILQQLLGIGVAQ